MVLMILFWKNPYCWAEEPIKKEKIFLKSLENIPKKCRFVDRTTIRFLFVVLPVVLVKHCHCFCSKIPWLFPCRSMTLFILRVYLIDAYKIHIYSFGGPYQKYLKKNSVVPGSLEKYT